MNIVLVSFEFPPLTATGGIGTYMWQLSQLLGRLGHDITVFSAAPTGTGLAVSTVNGFRHYLVPAGDNETFREAVVPVFADHLSLYRVDVMESPEVGACALSIKQQFPQVPLVVKMHTPGVLITKVSQVYTPLLTKLRFVAGALRRGKIDAGFWARQDPNKNNNDEYRICRLADVLICPSEALKKFAESYWGLSDKNISVVPNPFSLQESLFDFPIEDRPEQISFVGKLSILKGMTTLTAAIPEILRSRPGLRINIVGRDVVEDGKSMLAWMQEQLSEFQGQIIFTGALSKVELNKIYGTTKICIFPSLWENYPSVVLEARAAGCAIVAAKAGGLPEMLKNGETALLFDSMKSTELSKAVNYLLSNERKRQTMAENARRSLMRSMTNTTWEKLILSPYESFLIQSPI